MDENITTAADDARDAAEALTEEEIKDAVCLILIRYESLKIGLIDVYEGILDIGNTQQKRKPQGESPR